MLKIETEAGGTINEPSGGDIARAIRELSADGNSYAILSRSPTDYLQALRSDQGQFSVEYHDEPSDEHFRGKSDVSLEQALQMFESFRLKRDDWKQAVQWEAMELKGGKKGCAGGSAALLMLGIAGVFYVLR